MTKQINIGVRIREETRDAIAAAARDELRSLAGQVELILREWAVAHGYLSEAAKPGPARGRRRKAEPTAA
jgi:hypothetical protein